jgi:O-succinylbenzoate synthase
MPDLGARLSLAELQAALTVVTIPLTTRFRGVVAREAVLFEGPSGWGEWSPFLEYEPAEAARWLAAAIEAGWGEWPAPRRRQIPVNVIVPAIDPASASALVRASGGCRTAKVKVAEPGQALDDDIARVAAVRAALDAGGPSGRLRVDANGGWTVAEAEIALTELSAFDLEYAEQPCATLIEQQQLRRLVGIALAADESIRKADEPARVAGLREAADLIVVKVAPLGGIAAALRIVESIGLPAVVSSALETSIGLAAGIALAAAIPALPYACGLGSGQLLVDDVVTGRLLAVDGALPVTRPSADPDLIDRVRAGDDRMQWWRARLTAAYAHLPASRIGPSVNGR